VKCDFHMVMTQRRSNELSSHFLCGLLTFAFMSYFFNCMGNKHNVGDCEQGESLTAVQDTDPGDGQICYALFNANGNCVGHIKKTQVGDFGRLYDDGNLLIVADEPSSRGYKSSNITGFVVKVTTD
jgi:hypothetical protein